MDPTHYCRIWEVGLTLKCCHQRFRLKISGEVNVFFVITKFFFWLRFEILDSVMEQEKCTFCVCVFSFFLASVWKLTGQLEVNQTTETIDFQTTSTGVVYWWALRFGWMFFDFPRDLVVNYRDLTDFVRENFRAFFGEIYGLVKYYLSFPRDPGSPSENGFMKHKH